MEKKGAGKEESEKSGEKKVVGRFGLVEKILVDIFVLVLNFELLQEKGDKKRGVGKEVEEEKERKGVEKKGGGKD